MFGQLLFQRLQIRIQHEQEKNYDVYDDMQQDHGVQYNAVSGSARTSHHTAGVGWQPHNGHTVD